MFRQVSLSLIGVMCLYGSASFAQPSESPQVAMQSNQQTQQLSIDLEIEPIKKAWAEAKYDKSGSEQVAAFEALLAQIKSVVEAHPDAALPLVWKGTVLSSYASAKGGPAALSMAKEARRDLEAALAMDDAVADGFAHAVLGTLYHRVPGWPIGFKDNALAETHLKRALEISPHNIDANYYYGDFLARQQDFENANLHLAIVLQASPTDRIVAGRQAEAKATQAQYLKKEAA